MYADKQQQAYGYTTGGSATGGTLGSIGGYAEPMTARKPEVEAEMDRLAAAVESLAKISESLRVRLEPIRRKTGAGVESNQTSPPQPVQCTLASVIRDHRDAIELYTALLSSVLSELEI
jgi:hypothetical protein